MQSHLHRKNRVVKGTKAQTHSLKLQNRRERIVSKRDKVFANLLMMQLIMKLKIPQLLLQEVQLSEEEGMWQNECIGEG